MEAKNSLVTLWNLFGFGETVTLDMSYGPASEPPPPARAGGVQLAGRPFGARDELWQYVQALSERLGGSRAAGGAAGADEADTHLDGHDAFVFAALLGHHPEAAAKTAPGIARVGFGVNAEFPDTRSFFVVKTDGTKAGFSARKSTRFLEGAFAHSQMDDHELGVPREVLPTNLAAAQRVVDDEHLLVVRRVLSTSDARSNAPSAARAEAEAPAPGAAWHM